ncbi:phytanoyl-CoA dioxygenase family protein [Minwuia sp.]|uniref:phytanoyl-CoA dioxygenase family protein n=1 Tax=Minwuia sp. TaxID=2493630 RepID=UPI003A94AB92
MAIDDFIEPQAFRPAVPGPGLDEETAAFFNANGYAILRDHVPSETLDAIRGDVEALVQQNYRSQKDIHLKSAQVGDALPTDLIQGTVERFNGPSELLQSFAFTKLPNEVRTKHWHQDGVYWGLSDSRVCCLFVPMTATTEDNGCIWFVPGTHKLGRMYHRVATDEFGLQNLECEMSAFRDPVPMILQPGDAVIAHTYTVHGSFHNTTDEPRISLGFHFRNQETELRLPEPYRKAQAEKLGRDPAAAA